ncbi:hypothetical protein BpHYR1_051969 [Brachionus plicatilis]|uniref:Uncharacterized protein n=1 Tax=Brachionus plicatilis TaxID=10195 RepID=A0A3M7SD51_BRAPC|nr:hypothetical protein BpHYR1_051969 [Brachionus plicatilis]
MCNLTPFSFFINSPQMLHSTGFDCLFNAFFAANLAASDDSTGTKAISLNIGLIPAKTILTLYATFQEGHLESLCKMLNNAKYMLNIRKGSEKTLQFCRKMHHFAERFKTNFADLLKEKIIIIEIEVYSINEHYLLIDKEINLLFYFLSCLFYALGSLHIRVAAALRLQCLLEMIWNILAESIASLPHCIHNRTHSWNCAWTSYQTSMLKYHDRPTDSIDLMITISDLKNKYKTN